MADFKEEINRAYSALSRDGGVEECLLILESINERLEAVEEKLNG